MSRRRDWNSRMNRIPFDERTADRLLSGQLAPDDAPPGLAGLASFARAAAQPAADGTAWSPSLVTAMAEAVTAGETAPIDSSPNRRRSMLGKVLTAKAAAGLAAGILTAGTAAAAAAGALPGQASHHAQVAVSAATTATTGGSGTGSDSPGASGAAHSHGRHGASSGTSSASIPLTGPANVHAQYGLCTAFLGFNTRSSSTGSVAPSPTTSLPPQDSATPFRALISQNGSVANTITYCQGVVKNKPADDGTTDTPDNASGDTGKPAGVGKPSSTGRPSGTGAGNGATSVPPTSVPPTSDKPPLSTPASHDTATTTATPTTSSSTATSGDAGGQGSSTTATSTH